jgi:hypothetical protein
VKIDKDVFVKKVKEGKNVRRRKKDVVVLCKVWKEKLSIKNMEELSIVKK